MRYIFSILNLSQLYQALEKNGVSNGPQMIQNCDLVGTLYIPVSKIGSVNGILVTGAIKWQEKGHLAMILI